MSKEPENRQPVETPATVTIRLSRDLAGWLAVQAAEHGASVNGLIRAMAEQARAAGGFDTTVTELAAGYQRQAVIARTTAAAEAIRAGRRGPRRR